MNKYELAAKRHLAAKEAGWGENALQGIQNPLTKLNGDYNPYGAALLGGGTGLATYLISRLLGMKGGPSLIASLLGGLGGAHYAMGKQYAGNGKYNPFNIEYLRELINRLRSRNAEPQTSGDLPVNKNTPAPNPPPAVPDPNGASYDHGESTPVTQATPEEIANGRTGVIEGEGIPTGEEWQNQKNRESNARAWARIQKEAVPYVDKAKGIYGDIQQRAKQIRQMNELRNESEINANRANVLDKVVNGMETGANAIASGAKAAARGADRVNDVVMGTVAPAVGAAIGKGYNYAKDAAKNALNYANNTTGHDLFFGKEQPVQQGSAEAIETPAYKAPVRTKPNYPELLRRENTTSNIARGAANVADYAERGLSAGANAVANGVKGAARGIGNFTKDSANGLIDIFGNHLVPSAKQGAKDFYNYMTTPLEDLYNK